jgi:hypothetical protein
MQHLSGLPSPPPPPGRDVASPPGQNQDRAPRGAAVVAAENAARREAIAAREEKEREQMKREEMEAFEAAQARVAPRQTKGGATPRAAASADLGAWNSAHQDMKLVTDDEEQPDLMDMLLQESQ